MRCGGVWCGGVRFGKVRNILIMRVTLHGGIPVRSGLVRSGAVRCGKVLYGTVRNKMKIYRISIRGIHPLIWNVMKRELQNEMKQLKKDQLEEWETDRKNWLRKAEFDNGGDNVLIPSRWIGGMLINACIGTKLVPHFATTKRQTYTSYMSSVMFDEIEPVCKKEDLVGYGAYVGGQGKYSSTKVWRVRPMLEKWETNFKLIDPSGRMLKSELHELLEYGGLFVGIGDYRRGNFGRFDVVDIQEVTKKVMDLE